MKKQASRNIRLTTSRNPYRTLTTSSAYPASFNNFPNGNYLVIREDDENSSSWPS